MNIERASVYINPEKGHVKVIDDSGAIHHLHYAVDPGTTSVVAVVNTPTEKSDQ
jgi:hypothetical protein